MALTKIAATPHMLRLTMTLDEGGTDDLTQAALVALCAEGPLKSLLTSPLFQPSPGPGPNPNDWSDLHKDSRLTIRLAALGVSETASSFNFHVVSTVNTFSVTNNSGTTIVELQYENTLVR